MEKLQLKNTRTRENLMKAFAGESMARNRYCMFASIAEKEGYIEIAQIFRNTALNEKEHAEIYFKFLDGDDVVINNASYPSCYGDTLSNLLCASKYEEEENQILYPDFGRIAKEEGFDKISAAFYNIASIEAHHAQRYRKLAERLEKQIMFKNDKKIKWMCQHCGFVFEDLEAPKKCPVCSKEQGYFFRLCDCF